MPVLAGWITGEQVPQTTIEQTLETMGNVLAHRGGQPARLVQPGIGLLTFADTAYTMQHDEDPPVLDWVPDRRTFTYRRPLSGQHPLYYILDWPAEGNLLFASEIKALLAVGVPRRLHLPALDALLRYGFIPAPWTAFKDLSCVPAGSLLRWQRAKTVLNHASDYHLHEIADELDTLDQFHTRLKEAVTHMLPPHEHLVALTGGGASSALAILLAAQQTTASFSIASLGYKKSLSAKIWRKAESVADACQRPFLAVTGVDQPEFWLATLVAIESPATSTWPLALHQLLHATATETQARVAISGLGARILFNSRNDTPAEAQDALSAYQRLISPHTLSMPLWSQDVAERLQHEETWESTLHARKLERQATKFTARRTGQYYLDLHLRLPDLLVGPTQQIAIQEQMVIRSPYLNPRLLDWVTHRPTISGDGTPKRALLERLAQRYLLEETITSLSLAGPATSLWHIAESELLQQTITPEALHASGIFDPGAVERLLQSKETPTTRRALLFVFTTQLFYQLFGLSL
jgi:asparagine synthetase B (glutamine-hydrolysing)